MLKYALRPSFSFPVAIIFATTMAMVLPPQVLMTPVFATPPPPPPPEPPEDPCDSTCPPCTIAPPGRGQSSPARSDNPVILYNGAVQEKATDLSLPGPMFSWSQSRSYDSKVANASMTQLGRNWISGNGDIRLADAGSGNVYLITSASSKRTFTYSGGTYTAPAGSDLTLVESGGRFTLTHVTTGDIDVFYDFNEGGKSGRRIAHTNRAWDADNKDGIRYDYDTYGRLTTITTAEGQGEVIVFHYTSVSSWKLDWIRVGAGSGYYMEVDYMYGSESGTHSDCGADDDLVQVLVRNKGTDGNWIERYTQYRYYTSSPLDGKLKSVLESDAIQRIIDSGYTGITTPANILNTADSYTTGTSGSLPALSTRVSRSFTYHTSNETTTSYESAYSGATGFGINEIGYVASETINGGCASCGGGSGTGLTMEYHYINGEHFGSYSLSNITSNPTADGHINVVYWIVIEDVKSGGALLRRNVYGLSKDGYQLRKATMETASSTAIWCTSDVMRNDQRLRQRRMPSAHTSVDNADLETFLNPYNPSAMTPWTDPLDDGLVYVYGYNSAGWETDAFIRKGTGTEYYVSAKDYGNGMSAATWDVVATYEYPTPTIAANRSTGIATTYGYTYWDAPDFNQKQTITTTRTAVPTSQNGSSVAITTAQYFDRDGRLRWTQDGEGYINYYSYQPYTGELAFTATDVDPASTAPSGAIGNDTLWLSWEDDGDGDTSYDSSAIPTRSVSPTALALVTKREFDNQGRLRKTTDPDGSLDFISYQNNYVARYSHWNVGTANTLLPIQVTVLNNGGVATESLSIIGTSSAVSKPSSEPLGISSPARTDFTSWTRNFHSLANGQLVKSLRYHLIPASDDEHITHYYVTAFAYDAFGRQTTTVQTSTSTRHQVTKIVYDFLDRPTSTERVATSSGVNTDPNRNLGSLSFTSVLVASTEYDGGGVGDGHVTSSRSYYGIGGSDYVETLLKRTYRGHVRGIEKTNGGTAYTPRMVMDIDWMGRTTGAALYTTSITWASVLTGDGYTDFLSGNSTGRNEWNKTYYDKLNRTYRTERFPGTEATKHFENNSYYDRNDQLVATGDKYSAHTELAYDGAGRQYQQRTIIQLASPDGTYGQYTSGGPFTYVAPAPNPALGSMTGGDAGVIELSHTTYDDDGHATEQHTFEINHDDSTVGIDLSNNDDYVRRSALRWYDDADRLVVTADYGSGEGDASPDTWSYSASRPVWSGTEPDWDDSPVYSGYVLITKFGYDTAGRMATTTSGVSKNGSDTNRTTTKTFFDALGRRMAVAENWVDATANGTNAGGGTNHEDDRITTFAYNGLGQQTQITAINVTSGGTVDQVTKYLYEQPYNASLVTNTIYPDSSDTTSSGTDQVKLEYNLDGSLNKKTDQRGVVLEYTYDSARRPEKERVTNFGGSGVVDDSVKTIVRAYDSLGRLGIVTSYANDDGTGTVRNQIAIVIDNAVNKVNYTKQSHEGIVTSPTPTVGYTYDNSATSNVFDDGARLAGITYPNGRSISYTFGGTGTSTAIADRLNRITQLYSNIVNGYVAEYQYNGVNRLAQIDYPLPDIRRRMYDIGSAGTNVYNGLDRFGRTTDQYWYDYTSGTSDRDRIKYGYDYAGNRSWHEDVVAAANSVNLDDFYTYDGLQRLKTADQGDLTGSPYSSVTSKNFAQDWTLDQLGNWPTFKQDDDGSGSWDLNQSRTHNAANELTQIDSSSSYVAEDTAGNMTKVPKPTSWSANFDLKYDAWNRLVEVKDGGTTVATNEYDGLGRRIQRVVGSDTYDYYYNENWQLVEEKKNGTLQNDYVWHPDYIDALAVRFNFPTVNSYVEYYYLQDANFNVTAVTDNAGAVLERYAYTPYGKVTVLDANFTADANGITDIGNTHYYTGRELDPESGLQLNRRRFYASHLGRWVTQDPIGFASRTWNLYQYVAGRPTIALDPMGEAERYPGHPLADPGCCFGPPTPPWKDHYFGGGGENINVCNYSDTFKKIKDKLSTEIDAFKKRLSNTEQGELKCPAPTGDSFVLCETVNKNFAGWFPWEDTYPLGNSNVTMCADCTRELKCEKCNDGCYKPKSLKVSCKISISIDDAFRDAVDPFDNFPGEQEVGTPFKICGDWKDDFTQTTDLGGCR